MVIGINNLFNRLENKANTHNNIYILHTYYLARNKVLRLFTYMKISTVNFFSELIKFESFY